MTTPETATGSGARWCQRCQRSVETIRSGPVSHQTEHGEVHTQREDCAGCLQRVHETVTGPGAVAWAEAHGVVVSST